MQKLKEDSSSGYGEGSPVWSKTRKKPLEAPSAHSLNIQQLHKDILLHLKKDITITKQALRFYLEKIEKIVPVDHRTRWLVMKIKGLILYILKKPSDFRKAIVNGQITVYEKAVSFESPQSMVQDGDGGGNEFPSNFLTNNNFQSMELTPDLSLTGGGNDLTYNYSEDLFSGNVDSLVHFSRENYHILKSLASGEQTTSVFKAPPSLHSKIEKVCEMHECLDLNYAIVNTPKTTQSSSSISKEDIDMEVNAPPEEQPVDDDLSNAFIEHIFDNIINNVSEEELTEDFNKESDELHKWYFEMVSKLINLDLAQESPKEDKTEPCPGLDDSEPVASASLYNEENAKILKETCLLFRQNLAEIKFSLLETLDQLPSK